MKQCFAYARVSTIKQGEGVSLEAQHDAIKYYAERYNLEIVKWFEEKETAAKKGRPIFNRMLKELHRGKANGLVMHKIDRSARNFSDWAKIGDLADAGIDIHFATESLDFHSRGGRLTADIQAVIAADYIRNLQEESQKGIRGRLKQGIYPFPAPLGYCNAGSGKPKTLDPIRAPLIRELFDYYLSGDYSIRSLHHKMVERGLQTRGKRPISKRSIEHILQNSFYCGLMRNGRTGEIYPGIHEPIISAAEFERIKAIKSGRHVKKTTRHNHLFRRLFSCTLCSNVLTPEKQKGHVYYRCHTVGCPTKTIREELLEHAIIEALRRVQFSDTKKDKIDQSFSTWESYQVPQQSLELQISQAEGRLDKITDLFIDDKIDQITHDQKREAMRIEIAKLKEDQHQLTTVRVYEEDRVKFLELMKNVAKLYESADSAEKRLLIENCLSNRTWDGKCIYLQPSDLIQTVKDTRCVPYGGPYKDTIRTFLERFTKADNDNDEEYLGAA